MKLALFAALFLFLIPGLVLAQVGGGICFFSDSTGTDCTLGDTPPGILTVYVIHRFVPGASAIQFSAPKPACMVGATWLKDTPPFPVTVGDSQRAVSIGYGTCLSGPIHVLSINYAVSGTTTADCPYRAVPAASKFDIEVLDCAGDLQVGNGGTTYINSSLPCDCSGAAPGLPVLAVTPARLDFGPSEVVLPLQISNAGGGALSWQLLREVTWLLLDPPSGTGSATVAVTVNRKFLSTTGGVLHVVSNGGTIDVPVSVTVSRSALMYVDPKTLDFGESTTVATFKIQNIGRRSLNWNVTESVPWLTALPPSGTNSVFTGDAFIFVTVTRSGLAPGPYTEVVSVTSNGGAADVTVTMTVPSPVPILEFAPSALSFPTGSDSLPLTISNSGDPGLQWDIESDKPWLTVNLASGTDDSQVIAKVDRSGLGDASLLATLSITSNGGNATVSVVVNPVATPVEETTWGRIKALYYRPVASTTQKKL